MKEKWNEQARVTGDRRVQKIKEQFEKVGYFVMTNRDFNTGVDLIIVATNTGKIVKVIEATNYARKTEYIISDKFLRYLTSLNEFDVLPNVEKEIWVSFKENLNDTQYRILEQNKISVYIVGYQD